MIELLFNPTVVYVLLVLGLWLSATALYTPGTGILELIAVGVLLVAGWAMLSTGALLGGLLLLVVGVLWFTLAPLLMRRRRTGVAELGLAAHAIGAWVLYSGEQRVAWPMIVLMLLLGVAYNQFVLGRLLALNTQVTPPVDTLLNMEGRVVAPINPPTSGTVQVAGELWTARSTSPLEAHARVRVVEARGLELVVERAKEKHQPSASTYNAPTITDTPPPAAAPAPPHPDLPDDDALAQRARRA